MESKKFIITLFVLVIIITISGFIFLNNKIRVGQHPTQDEWLEVYITHKIHEAIDNTPRKVVVNTNVGENKIFVLLRSSTGQTAIPESGRVVYIEDVKSVIKNVLEENGLIKNYTFSVDYIPD